MPATNEASLGTWTKCQKFGNFLETFVCVPPRQGISVVRLSLHKYNEAAGHGARSGYQRNEIPAQRRRSVNPFADRYNVISRNRLVKVSRFVRAPPERLPMR